MNIRQQLQAILLLPVMVTLVLPATILFFSRSSVSPAFWLQSRRRAPLATGAMLLAMGLVLVVHTVRLFATRGRGTLAPWDHRNDWLFTAFTDMWCVVPHLIHDAAAAIRRPLISVLGGRSGSGVPLFRAQRGRDKFIWL